jgi:hypothetical protein
MTYIFSKKEAAVKLALPDKKETAVEFFSAAALNKHSPGAEELTYLDITGYQTADLKKTVTLLKKRCKTAPWGIIDLKGVSKDPAPWFFEGAADYMGPAALQSAGERRYKAAAAWKLTANGIVPKSENNSALPTNFGQEIKLNTSRFAGWKEVGAGSRVNVYLLYVSLQGKTSLQSRVGEASYKQLYKYFLGYLNRNLHDAEALQWMDTGKDCLFIIPPREAYANTAIASCLRILLSAPLVSVETFGLSIPVNFVFALHYGAITYQPPGKTGTIISDAVNFIFHLGAKKAELGRITISGETPNSTIPKKLLDNFVPAGNFEGRDLLQSRKFSYTKSWI